MQQELEEVKKERDRFVAFAFASADILIELSPNGEIYFAGGATNGLLGKKAPEIEGLKLSELVTEECKEAADNVLVGLTKKQRIDGVTLTLQPREGDAEGMPISLSGFRLGHSEDHMYISISAVRAEGHESGEIFRRDMYSGLLKKDSFIEEANQKIQEAQEEGEHVQVTLLDFPELKEFLDALPADVAMQLMGEISDYLRSESMDGDTAAVIGDGVYSFVHDEHIDEQKVVAKVMEITKKVDPQGKGVQAHSTTIEANADRLTSYDTANALLYTINKFAESADREDFSISNLAESYEDMLEDTVEKIAVFKDTVKFAEFDIAYQPIVELHNGVVHHYEALVRLQNSDTFSNPFQFVCFGEQAGVIGDFDLMMTQKTLDVLEELRKEGQYPKVAINLSGKSLSSTLFMDAFEKLLEKNSRLRRQVIIEVTESSKIQDMKAANDFLQRLRADGHKCCLDDFGVGESSFEYLRTMQVDFVKIDGSYVKDSIKTRRGREMLRAMSALCKDLGMATIGEFVEDFKTASLLWECGVRLGQGYMFGKPEIAVETLEGYNRKCEGYDGIVRAKRIQNDDRAWWSAKR